MIIMSETTIDVTIINTAISELNMANSGKIMNNNGLLMISQDSTMVFSE